eukprot:TRINITY_DN8459_c0_g1_i2.p1 TRINITY_DN8459_c0_g1~~TRINITY_DN8459_c0_g1_i2.p1  ORF type:complete len:437 (-),score=76.43 TRINITY_DN8459_c0_g1_i2:62-1372(-)
MQRTSLLSKALPAMMRGSALSLGSKAISPSSALGSSYFHSFTSCLMKPPNRNLFEFGVVLPRKFSSKKNDPDESDDERRPIQLNRRDDSSLKSKKHKPNWRQRRDKILRDFFFPGGRAINEDSLNKIREQLLHHPEAHLGIQEAETVKAIENAPQRHVCTALCTAEAFDFDKLYLHLAKISPSVTLTSPMNSAVSSGIISRPYGGGEVFYFEDGSIVCWSLNQDEIDKVLAELKPFEINPAAQPQTETMDFIEGPETSLIDDLVTISNTVEPKETTRHRLAFSYGMHQSVKLAFVEEKAENVISEIQNTPNKLVQNTFSITGAPNRKLNNEVKRQLADVLSIRGQVNLYSEFLETPDLFWDEPSLEYYYSLMTRNLEISKRISVMNKRLDYSYQVIDALKTQITSEHSTRMEWYIIILISIEVVQGFIAHFPGFFH